MAIKDKAHRAKPHQFEHCPPHQERYEHGTSDWNLETTACPTDSTKINTLNNSQVMSNSAKVGYPCYSDLDSPNIFKSTTDGKGRR